MALWKQLQETRTSYSKLAKKHEETTVELESSRANFEKLSSTLSNVSTIGARLACVEESNRGMAVAISELEEKLLLSERKSRRLELDAVMRSKDQSHEPSPAAEKQDTLPSAPGLAVDVLAEVEGLRDLASKRLIELKNSSIENSELRAQKWRLDEKVNTALSCDPRSLRELRGEISQLRQELARMNSSLKSIEDAYRESDEKKLLVHTELEEALKQRRSNMIALLDSLEADSVRLRKERDSMRELYEQANHQVLATNRHNSNLQQLIQSLQARVQTVEDRASRDRIISDLLGDISRSSEDSKVEELSKIIAQLNNDEATLYTELEVIGKAFEDIQGQNFALLKQISEKDEHCGKLLSEKLKAEFSAVQAKKDAEISLQKGHSLERESLERLESAESRERQARSQIIEAEARISLKTLDSEKANWRLRELSEENSTLRIRLDRYNSYKYEDTIAEQLKELDSLKFDKDRLQEEFTVVQKKLQAYADSGTGPQKDLQDELTIYKKLMKCNSCHTRDKNAVITKCMHVFCRQCLDIRIETRQRKCPNCGESFGNSDVRTIYL
ncbi:E3 ubiquitinprotein ligase Bre1like [Paramicrosporidium saccamoebae]|uniref:E3 ubiquitin protein ligase n=1 Tax=Paramicrosporidium saccamoebae TaxID=1246581 RepID=A0A2H9TM94_9FUNG|nr:E3 ubiquitinprotein ligase Bre1like [Paramicrosporidium saccamoebae]